MSPAATTTPPAVQAEILGRVLAMKHNYELPTIAIHFHMTLAELQPLLAGHGYPDKQKMSAARDRLQQDLVAAPATSSAAAHDGSTNGTTPPPADEPEKLVHVRVDKLTPDPNNPRDSLGDLDDLADSIKEVGLLQPIVARTEGSRLIVVAGHRRLAAVRLLRWQTVPCIIRPSMRPDHVIAAMLIENGQRADLDPIEEARGLMRLKAQLDCTDAVLAARVGRNQPYVSSRLALLSLTPEQQDEVRAGNMKLAEAVHRGRTNAGTHRKTGQDKGWHLGPTHPLANRAKARCIQLGHRRRPHCRRSRLRRRMLGARPPRRRTRTPRTPLRREGRLRHLRRRHHG